MAKAPDRKERRPEAAEAPEPGRPAGAPEASAAIPAEPAAMESAERARRESVQASFTVEEAGGAGAVEVSGSVAAAVELLDPATPVTAWQLAEPLLDRHPEYGDHLGGKLRYGNVPESEQTDRVGRWVGRVIGLYDAERLRSTHGVLHGRLLVAGLARLDPPLRRFFEETDFLALLEKELDPPLKEILAPERAADSEDGPGTDTGTGLPPDPAPLHVDSPAAEDQLGRESFARALASRLDRIRKEQHELLEQDRKARRKMTRHGFMMHLHGPWGSGKTSLLNLLRRQLQPPHAPDGEWIVVDFNAWQHQRLDPPWWSLLDTMYRQSVRQLRKPHRRPWHSGRVRAGELWRRLLATRGSTVLALALGLVLAAALFFGLPQLLPSDLAGGERVSKALAAIAGGISLVASGLLLATRTVLGGSSEAARSFVERSSDPMAWVTDHFQDLVDAVDRPILVFIDDLDRCQRDYVVQLLEGIQTLFRDPRVLYVVAADRRWINACFEGAYADFAESVCEPGRSLGSLFLEKAFQLSVQVPQLSQEDIAAYWGLLVQGEDPADAQRLARVRREVEAEFLGSETQDEILGLGGAAGGDPVRKQVARQVMVERLAATEAERSTEAFLLPFAPFLDGNPRSMKRLLNAYSLHRDIALLGGVDLLHPLRRRQLVMWTIVALRWPLLEEYLLLEAAGREPEPTPEIRGLMTSPTVRAVLDGRTADGHDVEAVLDLEAIRLFAHLSGTESPVGAIA